MAGLRFLVRLDLVSKFLFGIGSLTEWIDDVLQQGRRNKANNISDNQFLLRHKHHLKLLMPSDDLDKVSTCPAGQFMLLANSVGRLVASSRVGTLLFVPSFQDILIETVDRHTKDGIAEWRKSSSMLTQDNINEAIREANVRIGGAVGIEYIPQKRMVEVDFLSFNFRRKNAKLATGGTIFVLQR